MCHSVSIASYETPCAFLSLAFLPSAACNYFLNVSRVFSVLIEYSESIRKTFLASRTIKKNNLAKLRQNNSFSCLQMCNLTVFFSSTPPKIFDWKKVSNSSDIPSVGALGRKWLTCLPQSVSRFLVFQKSLNYKNKICHCMVRT